jgi:hypothetical protein
LGTEALSQPRVADQSCQGGEQRLAGVWDENAKAKLKAA